MAELRFTRSLYDEGAVRRAVEAFGALAKLELTEHPHELLVLIQDPHPRYAAVFEDELANYALTATVLSRAKGAA
jgi:hypothetical protein